MRASLQAKLLRVVQEREVRPVGGQPRRTDVRIVAATNADLGRRMDAGRFRRDFYYRLAGGTLEVPPLRHCGEDIPGLVEHFIARCAAEAGVRVRGLTVAAMRLLEAHSWPGNVRELEHEVRRLVFQATDGQVLDSGLLSPSVIGTLDAGGAEEAEPALALEPRLRALEAELIREALHRTRGKPTHAARLLGLSRNGLAKKMKRLGIAREE
jgi:two-component system response regulator HupR/HoxA